MKIWQKQYRQDNTTDSFTVGKDREMDLLLAKHDVNGTIAHVKMLSSCGLITPNEESSLVNELNVIMNTIEDGTFIIGEEAEDVHSQIELLLTQKLGETGKKVHTARSRNDQSLLDIKLFIREELFQIRRTTLDLAQALVDLGITHKDDLLPGYTHYQLAMPSSFGLWFGAYAESLLDDTEIIDAAIRTADKNPLGSAAGFGSSFPINREMTTELLSFSDMNISSVYAQMTRGKTEKVCSWSLAAVASTLAKLAGDIVLYMNQRFAYVSFPDELTTGSSIMPHKKNPDTWELIRAKCNRLQSLPNELTMLNINLTSGYHRDHQLTKEILFPAVAELKNILLVTKETIGHIQMRKNILEDEGYETLFTVEAINELVKQGVTFRDAYRVIGRQVEAGKFKRPDSIEYSHTGSIGKPGLEIISEKIKKKASVV